MRKRILAVLVAVITCLAVLSGCSAMKSLEKDANVVFMVGDKYVDGVTVNIFNNAIAPVFDEETVPEGFKFMGWSVKSDWKYGDDRDLLISSGGIVRYDTVKDYLNDGGTAIATPIIIDRNTIPRADLVIAWYSKSDTSGIEQANMDAFETNLRSYLTTQGYTPDEMQIVIRGYAGLVGPSCENIRKDDDVDIMLGWGGNIMSTGGMTEKHVKENIGGVSIGSKERYAARLSDSELTVLIYKWIQNEYGKGVVEEPDPEDPTIEYDIVIAWYSKSDTSGITQENITAVETALNVYLAEQGQTDKKVLFKGYDGDVATSCGNIIKDGNVDIMLGWSSNITTKGGMADIVKENIDGVTIGSVENRYAARLTDGDLTELVFKWVQNVYGKGVVEEPDPEQPTEQYDLVIAWYAKSATSGIAQENITAVEAALTAYLTEQGQTGKKVLFKGYDGDVATTCGNIMTDGNVDIMLGWVANIATTGKMPADMIKENVSGITVGSTERYAARLTDTELTNLVFNWIKQTYGKTENPDPGEDDKIQAHNLVIGWWNTSTSGLTQEIMDKFSAGLNSYLAAQGYDLSSFNIVIRNYDGDLATTAPMIINDNDVNIVLGYGKNLQSTGGVAYVSREAGFAMGTKTDRYIYQLTDSEFVKLIFDWTKTEEAKALLV